MNERVYASAWKCAVFRVIIIISVVSLSVALDLISTRKSA